MSAYKEFVVKVVQLCLLSPCAAGSELVMFQGSKSLAVVSNST